MKLVSRVKAAALALVPLLAACGGGASVATGTLSVKLHDAAVEGADAVYVTIDRVDVFQTVDGEEVQQTLVDDPQQWDLLELQNGVEAVLGEVSLAAGDYSSIRLVVGEDSAEAVEEAVENGTEATLKNYIVIDGEAHPLVVPSGTQTGIKFNHEFSISDDAITSLTFDFDVRKSVHQRGHSEVYSLRPTLRLVDTIVSGTVSGTVSTADDSPIPSGTIVSAQQEGVEVAAAIVNTDTGAYQIGPLLYGFYDLVVMAPGYEPQTELGVEVVAQTDSSGHDFVLVSGESGTIQGNVQPASDAVIVTLTTWPDNSFVAVVGVDDDGNFIFPSVPVGDYNVTVEAEGFETQLIEEIPLGDGETIDLFVDLVAL